MLHECFVVVVVVFIRSIVINQTNLAFLSLIKLVLPRQQVDSRSASFMTISERNAHVYLRVQ